MTYHKVKDGDSIASIAEKHKLLPAHVWNASENAELKTLRKDPNVLMPGDKVFVPEMEIKSLDGATGSRHRFKRLGVPSKLEIQFVEEDKPLASIAYRLDLDGNLINGMTDGDGWLKESIPPGAKKGQLIFDSGQEYTLKLGHLDPLDSIQGLCDRLENLGYPCGHDDRDELGDGTFAAICAFRSDNDMSIPDELNDEILDETRQALIKDHYS